MTAPAVWAVVLAAGAGARMGRAKLTLRWGDGTVLGQVLATLAVSPLAGVVVVVGCHAAEVAPIAAAHAVTLVENADWPSGMTSSLQAGLRALPPGSAGALVVLGDMPLVRADTIARLAGALAAGGADAVVPAIAGRRGHPVALGPRAVAAMLALPAGAPPRRALESAGLSVRLLDVADPAIVLDLDSAADYRALAARGGGR